MEPLTLDPSNYWRRQSNPGRDAVLAFLRGFLLCFPSTRGSTIEIVGDVVDFVNEVMDLAEKLPKLTVGQEIVIGSPVDPSNTDVLTAMSENTTTNENEQLDSSRRQETCYRPHRPKPRRRCPERRTTMASRQTATTSREIQPTTSCTTSVRSAKQRSAVKPSAVKCIPKRKRGSNFANPKGSKMVDLESQPSTSAKVSKSKIQVPSDNDSNDLPKVDFENPPSDSSSDNDPGPRFLDKSSQSCFKLQTAVGSVSVGSQTSKVPKRRYTPVSDSDSE